ncbi:MAG: hypothetical protein ACI4TI_03965, partial [Christensenellales bacterium]
KLVSNENLVKLLTKIFEEKNIKFEPQALNLIATRGEGCVRDTLSIADLCVSYTNKDVTYEKCLQALGASNIDGLIEICDALAFNNGEKLLTELGLLASSGKNFTVLNKELLNHLKTLLTIKTVSNAQQFLMMPDDYYAKMKQQADNFSGERLLLIMTKLSAIETQLKFSIDSRTMLEITLLGLLGDYGVQKKTINKQEEQKKTINNFVEQKISVENKNLSNSQVETSEENKNPTKVVAKILKYLRENCCHLLCSVFQTFESAKIDSNKLIISFLSESNKEILQNQENLNLINDIIKDDNLKIEYSFSVQEKTESVENILKQKFNEIEIKE